jgi:hypothetical protein
LWLTKENGFACEKKLELVFFVVCQMGCFRTKIETGILGTVLDAKNCNDL